LIRNESVDGLVTSEGAEGDMFAVGFGTNNTEPVSNYQAHATRAHARTGLERLERKKKLTLDR
jgi:hypothetical protein